MRAAFTIRQGIGTGKMSSFDKREEGFEKKFALDEEQKFKAEVRRNKLLGLWAAEKLGLSGDADVKGHKPMQTGVVNGWHCRYDLQTGQFDVPAVFSGHNAKAVVAESPGG